MDIDIDIYIYIMYMYIYITYTHTLYIYRIHTHIICRRRSYRSTSLKRCRRSHMAVVAVLMRERRRMIWLPS